MYLKAPQAFRCISGISCVSRATRGAIPPNIYNSFLAFFGRNVEEKAINTLKLRKHFDESRGYRA